MKHAICSPSRLERIIDCPGSVQRIRALMKQHVLPKEEPTSSYAAKGTELHEEIAIWLEKESYFPTREFADDEISAMQDCYDYASNLVAGHPGLIKGIERKVQLTSWGVPEVWGTSDFNAVNTFRRHADIVDWKFGSGIQVFAQDNPQCLAYAAGSVMWPTNIQTISIHIFQPYLDHISVWDITIADLHKWVFGTLAPAIYAAMHGDKTINPTQVACRWCEAKNHCPERFIVAQELATELFEAAQSLPKQVTQEQLVNLISKAPLVEKAIKDIKLFVKGEIERGRPYPGVKLVRGRSNRSWVEEATVIKWLTENSQIEDIFKSKLLSPSQLEKKDKTLKKNTDFQTLYHKPDGKATLVFESDPRPAIPSQSAAVDVFSDKLS